MKLSEDFALGVARLKRTEDGLIDGERWKIFFLHLQWSKWTKSFLEEPCDFLGVRKNKGRFALTFTDGSKARFWQYIEPSDDTSCEQVRYQIVVEIMEDGNETK